MAGISLGAVLQQDKGAVKSAALSVAQEQKPASPGRTVSMTENAARQALKLMKDGGNDPATTWRGHFRHPS